MGRTKLRNVETVRKITDGTSKWHTKTVMGFTDIDSVREKVKSREEGEIWEERISEHSKKWWRIENGIRVGYNVHPSIADQLRNVRLESKKFINCPKDICTCSNPRPIDEKFRLKTGMCEDCVITTETRLKIQGKFKDYAIEKMKNNAEAFFKQTDQEVEEMKRHLQSGINFVDGNGDVEEWRSDNPTNLLSKIDETYDHFKKSTIEKLSGESNASQT